MLVVTFNNGKLIIQLEWPNKSFGIKQRHLRTLRWRSSGPPTQLIVFTNSAETKPFTQLNSRYSVNSSGSW